MPEATRGRLAVVGLAAAAGSLADLSELEPALVRGRAVGPAPVGTSGPALLRRLALAALADAGLAERAAVGLVTVASAYPHDQAAGYLATGLGLGGPARALRPGVLAEVDALDLAASLLAEGQVVAVLLAAARVDAPSEAADGCAMVLTMPERPGGHHVRAVVEAWARGAMAAEAVGRALAIAGIRPRDVGYLQASTEDGRDASTTRSPHPNPAYGASGLPASKRVPFGPRSGREGEWMVRNPGGDAPTAWEHVAPRPDDAAELAGAYQDGAAEPTGALDSAAGGPVALAAVVLAVWRRSLPACPAPPDPRTWAGGPFFAPPEPRPWFLPPGTDRRFAALHRAGGGLHTHVVLGEATAPTASRARFRATDQPHLVTLAAADTARLLAALDGADAALAAGVDPRRLAHESAGVGTNPPDTALGVGPPGQPGVGGDAGLAVALLGRGRDELREELGAARRGIPLAVAGGGEWRTPRGSVFAARPAGALGGVAFVYPGAFSSYVGAACEAFRLFPWAYDDLADLRSTLGEAFHEQLLYPRWVGRPSVAEQTAADLRLAADALAMIESGTMVATIHTRALRRVFGVEPSFAFGYSLGEVMMLLALGVWMGGDDAQRRLVSSPLFTTQLVGPKLAVRRLWGLPPGEPLRWDARILLASADRVMAAIPEGERIYLTIVNGPEEVGVAGDPAACDRLAARLGCDMVPSPFDHVLHCPATELELAEFARQMHVPTHHVPDVAFYSAGSAAPLALDEEQLASALAEMSCRRLDFVELVERTYAAGARVFVEVGPGAATTRLIQAILKGRDHVAVAVSRRGLDDQSAWYRALAALVAHRVPIDLAALHTS